MFEEVKKDIEDGLVILRNFNKKQKAIFLDRDGTINKYVGFLRDIDEFVLINGVCDAIKRINESGYLAIIVTNQPVIARGEMSLEQLDEIHKKMETLLGKAGAFIDGLYFCPHHPDSGYVGEVAELKKVCSCRKPEPGMLFQAARDYNIDLSKSWIVGDDSRDVKCGKKAGVKTVLLGESAGGIEADFIAKDLKDAVYNIILN